MSTVALRIPFPTSELADIAKQALEPDSEVKPLEVQRTFTVHDKILHVDFTCVSARMARVSLQAFFDNIEVVIRTMLELEDV